jgi:hypothetical protein
MWKWRLYVGFVLFGASASFLSGYEAIGFVTVAVSLAATT